jgi:hypothetical protein
VKKLIPALVTLFLLTACSRSKPDAPYHAPAVSTDAVVGITTTSAVGGGVLTNKGNPAITSLGFEWATDSNFTGSRQVFGKIGANGYSFLDTITGLSPATTYYARAFATNSGGTIYGDTVVEFTTNNASSDYTVSTYAKFPDSTNLLTGVAVAPGGMLYVSSEQGTMWTVSPNGAIAYLTNIVGEVQDVVADSHGNCFELTMGNISWISPSGSVGSWAGGAPGQVDGPGYKAGFSDLRCADIDGADNIYVGDLYSIRKIDATSYVTTLYTLPGNGDPISGIAVDKAHNIYFATPGAIYRVDSLGQHMTFIAGVANNRASYDGTGSGAGFFGIYGLRMNKDGNLLAADGIKIRIVTPAGVVTTLAGTADIQGGFRDGAANIAQFFYTHHLAIDSVGTIYVADNRNVRIRKIVHK